MAERELIFATIVANPDLSDIALFQSPGFQTHPSAVHCLVVGDEPSDMPRRAERWGLERLSVSADALRFAMDESEIVTLVKPRFLRALARSEPTAQVLFVDATCWMRASPEMTAIEMANAIELFSGLGEATARRFPAFSQALAGGVGMPTGDVIRLQNSDERTVAVLEDWDRWMFHRYVVDPTTRLQTDEATYLGSLLGSRDAVSWGDPATYATLDPYEPLGDVAIVGTRGCVDRTVLSAPGIAVTDARPVVSDPSSELWDEIQEPDPSEDLARSVLRAVDPTGRRWETPGDDFLSWLEERDSGGLSRLSRSVYWTRPDLRVSFPPRATSSEVFDDWFNRVALGRDVADGSTRSVSRAGRAVDRVRRRLARRSIPKLADSRRLNPGAYGINVVGFLSAATGLGSAARSTQDALESQQIDVASLDLSDRIVTGRVEYESTSIEGMPFDTSIFHLNPEELVGYATDSLAYRLGTGRNIGFFFWETDRIPDSWLEGIDAVDEIWVGSTFVAEAFRRATTKDVHVVGLPVEPVDIVRTGRHGDAGFVVSYVADLGSGALRKNPVAVIDAFRVAFGHMFDEVHLTMKIGNLERFPRLRARLHTEARDMPIEIIEGYIGRKQLRTLIAESDAYLSLHRSEGLGLTMLEAMDVGVPVIATGYGGNTDFMSGDSGRLVDFSLVQAGDDAGPYVGHHWAEPDIGHAASLLRELQADPQLAGAIGRRGREIVRRRYSTEAFRRSVSKALEQSGVLRGAQ